MSTTAEKVRAILAAQLDIDEEKIGPATSIADDLGADSLDVVELMMSIEEDFGVSIDEDAVRSFNTVGDVVNYIEEKL
ncbi:MAG: acyl carrier protein [Oscillospiraceae bacterium]|jgi:acyl carrier protein|nr:acyl carrier protein [Oscillospiraceae bacterium]